MSGGGDWDPLCWQGCPRRKQQEKKLTEDLSIHLIIGDLGEIDVMILDLRTGIQGEVYFGRVETTEEKYGL